MISWINIPFMQHSGKNGVGYLFDLVYQKKNIQPELEVLFMEAKKIMINRIKPPCPKCPYTLGLVETPVNPCPKCKLNGYQSYEWFLKLSWQGTAHKNKGK